MSLAAPEAQDLLLIGATGDLARRKLLPALFRLAQQGLLPADGQIIGYARSPYSDDQFRDLAAEAVRAAGEILSGDAWERFAARLIFVCAKDGGMAAVARRGTQSTRLIYLATPPSAFAPAARELADHDLVKGARIVIEKPLGHDRASSAALDRGLHDCFDEQQIFRIDHYLGKETVQNILAFRFANSLFERAWDRDAIAHVQITLAEAIGVEGRGAFYDEVGALRDVVQNHALQILSLLAMEPPASFDAEAIRDEKVKLLRAVQPFDPADVVRGQYGPGPLAGREVPGFRDEAGASPDSETETWLAVRLRIENWRWAGVPFYLRAGKRLPRRATEVFVGFRPAPIRPFERVGAHMDPDHLTIRIQPDEGIALSFLAKEPGPEMRVRPVTMDFSYRAAFDAEPAEAYERVLHAAMVGDHTVFARADEVDRAWAIVQPVLDAPPPIRLYPAGSWGPAEADGLIAPDRWHLR